jgi:hypothetical protein
MLGGALAVMALRAGLIAGVAYLVKPPSTRTCSASTSGS